MNQTVVNHRANPKNHWLRILRSRQPAGGVKQLLLSCSLGLAGLIACQGGAGQLGSRSSVASASASASALAERLSASDLDQWLAAAFVETQTVGGAVAIVSASQRYYLRGFGQRSLADKSPVNSDTRFLLGSVGKTLTGTMVASMVDEGLFSWDQSAVSLLPEFAAPAELNREKITIRHLLTHGSGIARFDSPLVVEQMAPTRLVEFLGQMPATGRGLGSFAYCNQALATGAFIATLAAGASFDDTALLQSFHQQMHSRVLKPLQMTRSTFDFDAALADPNHAQGHAFSPDRDATTRVDFAWERFVSGGMAPAGGMWTTATDLSRFAQMQLRGGKGGSGQAVVSESQLAETHKIHTPMGTKGTRGYGIGWTINRSKPLEMLQHNGASIGFTSHVTLIPELDVAVIVLLNGPDLISKALQAYVAARLQQAPPPAVDWAAKRKKRIAIRARLRGPELGAIEPASVTQMDQLLGHYGRSVRISRQSGQMMMLHTDLGSVQLEVVSQQPLVLSPKNYLWRLLVQAGSGLPSDSISVALRSGDPSQPLFRWTLARSQPVSP